MADETKVKLYSVSHTKLAIFRRCLQQYHWKYVDKYYPPSAQGQIRGTAGHAALAVWHRSYKEQEAVDAAWQVWETYSLPADEQWEVLFAALLRYMEWSKQNDKFTLVEAEHEFKIEFMLPNGGGEFLFTGFIDGIVNEKNQLWLLENKFYKRMDNNPLDLDPQVSMYMLASHLLEYKVQGVIYNIVRVADTKIAATEPVVRRRIYRNPAGLKYIQVEMGRQVQAMQNYEQKGGVPYRNPTKDCSWDCPFYQPCLAMTDDSLEPTHLLQIISQTRSNQDAKTIEEW